MTDVGVALPRLLVFTDTARAPMATWLSCIDALCRAARPKTLLFVVRDYALPLRERLELAQHVREVTAREQQLWGIAERADIARALGAHSLHLPESGLSTIDARQFVGPEMLITCACHDVAYAASAVGADALLLSPVLESRKGRAALGLDALRRAAAGRGPRWFALGGVDAGNAAACIAAGAAGVAVIGAALAADGRALLTALQLLRTQPA